MKLTFLTVNQFVMKLTFPNFKPVRDEIDIFFCKPVHDKLTFLTVNQFVRKLTFFNCKPVHDKLTFLTVNQFVMKLTFFSVNQFMIN